MASVNAHLKSLEEAWGTGGGPSALTPEDDEDEDQASSEPNPNNSSVNSNPSTALQSTTAVN